MKKQRRSNRRPTRRKLIKKDLSAPSTLFPPPLPQPEANTIYKFATSKHALAALPSDARSILFIGGHIVNELTTLTRLLVFTKLSENSDPIEDAYVSVQYVTLVRLLIGKVAEALETVHKRIIAQPLGRTYLPLVEQQGEEGTEVVANLRRMVGENGLLSRLRNQHAFHNPADHLLEAAFGKLDEGLNWSMMAGSPRHTVLFPMSSIVAIQALNDSTGKSDPREAITAIRDEVLGASDAVITFFEYLTITMSNKHNLFSGSREAVKDTSSLPPAQGIRIPPICRASE